MSSEYSFKFTLEEAELSQFMREHSKSKGMARGAIWFLAIAMGFSLVLGGISTLQKNAVQGDQVVGVLLAAAGVAIPLTVLFSARLNTWWLMRRLRKLRADVLDEQTLVISEAGIQASGRRASTHIHWIAIKDIVDRAGLVRFMLEEKTGLILPHRVIERVSLIPADVVSQAAQWRSKSPPAEHECPRCRYDLRGASQDGCPECGWRRSGQP